ncbi:rCG30124 [Rattus norvegicus]|uniref:RCG30124 n=1 Tax=Rattus norvegicus TaxID=10116 RepID=A6IL09_RAT|nr:rCG30124 [Rattus norvegicus]
MKTCSDGDTEGQREMECVVDPSLCWPRPDFRDPSLAHRGGKWTPDPLELELQMVMSHYVCAWN